MGKFSDKQKKIWWKKLIQEKTHFLLLREKKLKKYWNLFQIDHFSSLLVSELPSRSTDSTSIQEVFIFVAEKFLTFFLEWR